MLIRLSVALSVAVFLCSSIAHGQTVFNNGFPIVGGGAGTDVLSDARAPLQAADDFTLTATAGPFSKVIWWGVVGPPGSARGNFMVEIYMDDPATPGQPAAFPIMAFDSTIYGISRINTGLTNGGFPIYRYRMNIPPTSLPPGTRFWLSVYKTGSAGTPWFYFMKSNLAGNFHLRPYLFNGTWYPGSTFFSTGELAFRLR